MFKIANETVKNNCLAEIKSLPLGKYQVEIKEIKRSTNANNLYWKHVTIIADTLGYTSEEMHDAFKRQFLGVDQGIDMFGNFYLMPKSSAKLKKSEFSTYMNKVQAFASSQGILLPSPDYYGLGRY